MFSEIILCLIARVIFFESNNLSLSAAVVPEIPLSNVWCHCEAWVFQFSHIGPQLSIMDGMVAQLVVRRLSARRSLGQTPTWHISVFFPCMCGFSSTDQKRAF